MARRSALREVANNHENTPQIDFAEEMTKGTTIRYRTQTLKNNKMQPRAINFPKNIWKLLNKRLFLRCQS